MSTKPSSRRYGSTIHAHGSHAATDEILIVVVSGGGSDDAAPRVAGAAVVGPQAESHGLPATTLAVAARRSCRRLMPPSLMGGHAAPKRRLAQWSRTTLSAPCVAA